MKKKKSYLPKDVPVDQKGNPLKVGDVVRSIAGRDKKRVFLITAVSREGKNPSVSIANGTLRTMIDRKQKNPAHLLYIASLEDSDIIHVENGANDSEIAAICSRYDFLKD